MRTLTKLAPLGLLAGAVAAVQAACGSVPNDTIPGNEFPPAGVIRGTVFYSGPPPCTQDGQIVGNAVILIFDRKNPPPPAGLANTAVNFGVVSGDVLFANVPRTPGSAKVCPGAGAAAVTASAPYAISPMAAGSFVIQAFYDYTGDFLATFKFRNLPEATDVGGGYIDINDAQKLVPDGNDPVLIDAGIPKGATSPVIVTTYPLAPKSSNSSYQPIFLPVDIGTPGTVSPTSLRGVPDFTMPDTGYVADNVTVSIGSPLNFARPYFYPQGIVNPPGQSNADVKLYPSSEIRPGTPIKTPANPTGDVDFIPVLSYPQDILVDAQPVGADATIHLKAADEYQASIPQLLIHWGVPGIEQKVATDITSVANPFHMQLNTGALLAPGQAPGGNGGLYVFQYDSTDQQQFNIPEGSVPRLWPLVVLAKLKDDPNHTSDPESVTYQGSDGKEPIVIIQGITLSNDSLVSTALPGALGLSPLLFHPDPTNLVDHFTVMLRPNVLCLDPNHVDQGGVLVTPALCGPLAKDETSSGNAATCGSATLGNILQPSVTSQAQLTQLVKQGVDAQGNPLGLQFGCLPTGRYGVNVVYPTGQAWTTPNEMGRCAGAEGNTVLGVVGKQLQDPGTCAGKPRPVLYSQGTRAVVEITPGSPGSCCVAGSKNCNAGAIPPVPAVCTTLPPGE